MSEFSMITLSSIIFLGILLALVAFWQSNARARELANRVAEQVCERETLQFLDGTTLLNRIHIKRNNEGKLTWVRHFTFDFYNGFERLTGKISVAEHKITDIYIEKPLAEPEPAREPTNLFQSANEVNNVITFPGPKKDDNK